LAAALRASMAAVAAKEAILEAFMVGSPVVAWFSGRWVKGAGGVPTLVCRSRG